MPYGYETVDTRMTYSSLLKALVMVACGILLGFVFEFVMPRSRHRPLARTRSHGAKNSTVACATASAIASRNDASASRSASKRLDR